jgi:hypothetical protein
MALQTKHPLILDPGDDGFVRSIVKQLSMQSPPMNRLRMRRSRAALTDGIPDFLIGDRFESSALRHPLPETVEITNGLLYFG